MVISPYFQNSSEIFHFLYISQFSKSIFSSSLISYVLSVSVDTMTYLASECLFVRVNSCHGRGTGWKNLSVTSAINQFLYPYLGCWGESVLALFPFGSRQITYARFKISVLQSSRCMNLSVNGSSETIRNRVTSAKRSQPSWTN